MTMNLSRITLRPFKLSDVDDFMLVAGDDRVTRYTRRETFASREQALCYIQDVCIPHPWTRSICIDNQTIGFISISPAGSGDDDDRCRAEIGYAIAANYWGQGICTKAMKVAVSQVFKDIPDLVRIQAFVSVENQASERVLEKTGFLREGILRKFSYVKGRVKDVAIFSLLSEDALSLQ
jgi:RimJ/RimL family protein N-acetyltransferase